jgi:hypothetical protein
MSLLKRSRHIIESSFLWTHISGDTQSDTLITSNVLKNVKG